MSMDDLTTTALYLGLADLLSDRAAVAGACCDCGAATRWRRCTACQRRHNAAIRRARRAALRAAAEKEEP